MISGSAYDSKPNKINMMMKNMILLSSIFRSKENLSKDVKKNEEGEVEGPCTSYSHREEGMKHEEHLEFEILSEYLDEYWENPRTLDLRQFIQQKEERIPHNFGMMRGNWFLLSTFDGSLTCDLAELQWGLHH